MNVIKQLENLFQTLNDYLFARKLPLPVIKLNSSNNGWTFRIKNDYEITIDPETLKVPLDALVKDMLHCMIHEYCDVHGLKDTCRDQRYHNRVFYQYGSQYGLCFKFVKKEGYITTGISDDLMKYAQEHLLDWYNSFLLTLEKEDQNMKPGKYFTWECPICKAKILATKDAYVYCGWCRIQMQMKSAKGENIADKHRRNVTRINQSLSDLLQK